MENCKSLRKTVWWCPTIKCVLKNMYKKLVTRMFREALFLIAKVKNISKYINKRTVKLLLYLHTRENYSIIKRIILIHSRMGMNIKNIMLTKRSRTLKNISHMISPICSPRTDKQPLPAGRRPVVSSSQGGGVPCRVATALAVVARGQQWV